MALGLLVIGIMVAAGRIPADKALLPLATVAIFAWLADASVRRGRRGTTAPAQVAATSPAQTLKRCPSCGAQVHPRAKLCYCDHEFS
jgi:hypothetical protein